MKIYVETGSDGHDYLVIAKSENGEPLIMTNGERTFDISRFDVIDKTSMVVCCLKLPPDAGSVVLE